MNSRSPIGRALQMGNMRIVRSAAASFFKFLFIVLVRVGQLAPPLLIFVIIFMMGFVYSDITFINSLSELTGSGSELNHCAALLRGY